MWIASGAAMRTSLAALLLALAAFGCTTDTTSTTGADPEKAAAAALPADQQALLGSYEIPLRRDGEFSGGSSYRLRLDFVAGASGVEAYIQSNNIYGLGFVKPALALSTNAAAMVFTLQNRQVTLTVARKDDGRPSTAVIDALFGQTYSGDVGPDITPPQFERGVSQAQPPWEATYVSFSETLRAKDIVLPASGSVAYSLAAIDGTPWVGALGLRKPLSSSWDDTKPLQLEALDAKDPSGNALKSNGFAIGVLPVGKAVKSYDFAKDNPAFPQLVNRLVGDCDGAEACLRVSQGSKIGFRIAAGSRTLRLRYALRAGQFAGSAPKPTVKLTGVVAPGDGSATTELPKLEVTWAAVPTPTTTRAFTTAYADLLIPLPKLEAETGISLQFDGEPRDTDKTGAATGPSPSNPSGSLTVEARHMVMLLHSARAE